MADLTCGSGGSTGQEIVNTINKNTNDNVSQESAIGDNASNIATNTSDIATNKTNIQSNTNQLATNTPAIADNHAEILNRVYWKGNWSAGDYIKNDAVLDGDWLMIANKDTNERPSPQPVGEPFDLYDGMIGSNEVIAKQVIFGNRYTVGHSAQVSEVRVYIISGNTYTLYGITNPTTNPIITQGVTFTAHTTGWKNVAISPRLLGEGETFDIIAIMFEPDPTPIEFHGNWSYTTPNNAGSPSNGQIIHANSSPEVIAINVTDTDGTNRATELNALTVGDVIELDNMRWAIQALTSFGSYIDFLVSPATQYGSQGVFEFTFETKAATPVTYGVDVGYNTGNTTVRGLLAVDSAYDDITPDTNQYGIDIVVQEMNKSADWDVMSTAGGSSSLNSAGAPAEYDADSMNSTDNPELADIGTIWIQGAQLDEPMPAGRYMVGYSFTFSFAATNQSAEWRFNLNGGAWEEYNKESSDGDDIDSRSYQFPYDHPGGNISISTQFQKTGGTATYDVKYSNVWIDRKE